jgi:AAA domain
MNDVYDELWRRKDHGYGCIVLDSLSEIQKLSMASIMAGEVWRNPDVDPDIPSQRNWGKNINQIRRLVRQFRDLPVPTIFTALAQDDKDERTGRLLRKPALSGKLANEVAGFFDIVGYFYIKEVQSQQTRFMLTGGAEGIVAKDRSERLPPILESPTMKAVYDCITKGNE